MSNRHLARTVALQTLFECDFSDFEKNPSEVFKKNLKEFAPGYRDNGFAEVLVRGVIQYRKEIDESINIYAIEWPVEKIYIVDRNVLRIGIFELKYLHDVPPKVSINEAIELTKAFGTSKSSKFVNGVLGALLKDLEKTGRIHTKTMLSNGGERQISSGGMVYHKDEKGNFKFALVKDAIGRWTFAKGKMGVGEDLKEVAKREIFEEIGLKNLTIHEKLGEISITVNEPDKAPIPKVVHYYLIESKDYDMNVSKEPELQDAAWFDADTALGLFGYENARTIFRDGLKKLGFRIEAVVQEKKEV